jgi:hypothetical protein
VGDLDLFPGAIAGYRAFRLFGGRLWSLTANAPAHAASRSIPCTHQEWPVGETTTAVCGLGRYHRSPDGDCSCGLWAYKDLQGLLDEPMVQGPRWGRPMGPETQLVGCPTVLCLVACWGKVVEDEIGFRAEKAVPVAAIRFPGEDPADRWLGDRYPDPMLPGLPCVTPDALPGVVRGLGLTVLEREEAEPVHVQDGWGVAQPHVHAVFWGLPPQQQVARRAGYLARARAWFAGTVRAALDATRAEEPFRYGSRCCGNGEPHERSGAWCRWAFRAFFGGAPEPLGSGLSLGDVLGAEPANRRPWLRGFQRAKGRG